MCSVSTLGLGLMLCLVGCDQSEIRRYEVAKQGTATNGASSATATQDAQGEPQRLIAAIWPRSEKTWFFKLMGPPDEVAPHEEAFQQFVRSVHFPEQGGEEIHWDLPEGWQEEAGTGMRHATLYIGDASSGLEVSVIPLPAAASDVLPNVNRWRGQIGLDPVGKEQVAEVTSEAEIGGHSVTFVDMTGPGGSGGSSMAPFAQGMPDASGSESSPSAPQEGMPSPSGGNGADRPSASLDYEVPQGWENSSSGSAMREASFQVNEDGQSADISVIALPGDGGGLMANVNRWRREVGLESVDKAQIEKTRQPISVAGEDGAYFDLQASKGDSPDSPRILAVMVTHQEQTWFFKMTGPSGLLEQERAAFERFVQSVAFNSQAGGGSNGQ